MRATLRWMAKAYAAKPRKLPMPDAGGRTSSVKTWLLLYTDAKFDIYIYLHFSECGKVICPFAAGVFVNVS
jgi:hypothetical protein